MMQTPQRRLFENIKAQVECGDQGAAASPSKAVGVGNSFLDISACLFIVRLLSFGLSFLDHCWALFAQKRANWSPKCVSSASQAQMRLPSPQFDMQKRRVQAHLSLAISAPQL